MSFLRSGRQWPLILVGILVLAAVANGILVYKAAHDPSFAVEPDYYRRALAWDERVAEERRGRRLGWSIEAELVGNSATQGAELRLRLRDRDGRPISGARIEVAALHKARASRVLHAQLAVDGEAGHYHATLPARRPGLWEVALRAERGGARMSQTVVLELLRPGILAGGRSAP